MALLSITTQERVLRLLDFDDPAGNDDANLGDLVDALILGVSKAFEDYLQLPLLTASRTEIYSAGKWSNNIWLRSYFGREMPVPTITSLKVRSNWQVDFADVDAVTATEYRLSSEIPGVLIYSSYFPEGEDTVQVVYSSGFAATTSAFIAAFPAISMACDQQIAWEYKRRRNPGQSSESMQGSVSYQQSEMKLLESVRERLHPYRRFALGW